MTRTASGGIVGVLRGRAPLILAATCGAEFMLMIDDTVVNVALPTIGRSLDFTAGLLPWIVDAYMILFGGFMIFDGRLADLFGRRRVFVIGLAMFVSGSLAAGLSPSARFLIAARAVQGFGGALLAPAALGILASTFHDPVQRRRAVGAWGATTGFSGIAGVLLGGIITGLLGWRWVFLINAPVAVLILILLFLYGSTETERRGRDTPLDLAGALLISSGLVTLVWAVLRAPTHGWSHVGTLAPLGASIVLICCFLAREARTTEPLVDLRLFRRSGFAASIACMFLAAAGMYSMVFFLTQYMQTVQGWSPIRTGVSWLSFGAPFVLATAVSIKLVPRLGTRALIIAAGILGCAGQLVLTRTTAGGSYWLQLAPAIALMGAGIGIAFVPVYVTALRECATGDSGVVAGVLGTMQQVGGAVGVAVLGSVAIGRGRFVLGQTDNLRLALLAGFHRSFLLAALCMLALGAVALVLPSISQEVDLEAVQGW
jgi:EmrB/QacA subfamily drug resistance transporter